MTDRPIANFAVNALVWLIAICAWLICWLVMTIEGLRPKYIKQRKGIKNV